MCATDRGIDVFHGSKSQCFNNTTIQQLRMTYQFIPTQQPTTAPTVLLLHGTGGDEHDFIDLGKDLFSNANLLGVRGNVLENGTTTRFFRRTAEGVFDEQDLIFRTHELANFVTQLADKEGFSLDKLTALGYSNGANIAGSLLFLYPDLLKGAVLWRGMMPYQKPPIIASVQKAHVLMTSGSQDFYYRPTDMDIYEQILTEKGFTIEHHVLQTGHNLVRQDLTLTANWWKNVNG